ncbi:MAG: chitinase [Actinomycetota bacterium]|nr:chitinase [Actinomycetota bacterium]
MMITTPDASLAAQDDRPIDPTPDSTTERLSWSRLGLLLGLVAVVAGSIYLGVRFTRADPVPSGRSWSVPYVDVTLTPSYEFQDPQSNPARNVALAFVVADPNDGCAPSWGGAYSLDAAAQELELDRRIAQLRAAGGDVMVSFGGQANEELAYACTDEARLTDAYRAVIDRYDLDSIDLDIENADLADAASIERRAAAIATIQAERKSGGKELHVWLTLPAATGGLTADGTSLVAKTLDGGVTLTGVNAMTMNFGTPDQPTVDMLGATQRALEATARQLEQVYSDRGTTLTADDVWAKVGATPMIGQNDVVGEVFTLEDARGLAEFALARGLGRVSTWSLNRDAPCSPSFADVMVLSNTCSSVTQDPLEFANVFATLPGRSPADAGGDVVTVTDPPTVEDDAATSPYPIWRPDAQYPDGYKVVRGGMVYEAKWYTQGDDPSRVTANPWDTPWGLIGPVSPDDEPYTPTTLAAGTHPAWDPKKLYTTGDTVLFDGLPYEARWPSQGEAPSTLFPVGPDSAWEPLFTLPGEPTTP